MKSKPFEFRVTGATRKITLTQYGNNLSIDTSIGMGLVGWYIPPITQWLLADPYEEISWATVAWVNDDQTVNLSFVTRHGGLGGRQNIPVVLTLNEGAPNFGCFVVKCK